MSHEIFGERFVSRARPAWHSLGRVFDLNDPITAREAIDEIGGDVIIRKIPFTLEIGDAKVATGKSAIVRMPNKLNPDHEVFGTVSGNRYDVVQYTELGEALDPVSQAYPLETAGILKGGRFMFVGLRAGSFDVKGIDSERVDNYVVVLMSQEPGTSHRLIHTPVRVVCKNTLVYSQERAAINLPIPHTKNSADILAFGAELVANLDRKIHQTKIMYDAMASVPLGDAGLDAILAAAFPEPSKPKNVRFFEDQGIDLATLADRDDKALYEKIKTAHDAWAYKVARNAKRREGAAWAYEMICDEHPAIAGTVYAGYQAVTETSDWRDGRGEIAYSTILGSRADEKVRAFNAASELAKLNLN